jgi:hypothetical protein
MNLDMRAEPKRHGIRLTLKNFTETDLKLHSYVSSAPPLSRLPDMLNYSNEDTLNHLDFEFSKDSEHGIWIRYCYVGNEASGFDVCICASFSKSHGIIMNTYVCYIDGWQEKKILSREAVYTMHNNGGVTQYRVNDSTPNRSVEIVNNLMMSARVRHGIVNTDSWDLCASIDVQFLITAF